MKSQPVSACAFKAKLRNLGICERSGRSAPPRTHRVKEFLTLQNPGVLQAQPEGGLHTHVGGDVVVEVHCQ